VRPSPGRAGDRDAGPWIEACNAPLRPRAGQFWLVCANRSHVMVSRLGEAGRNHAPMLLAGVPTEDGAVSGIRDGVDDAGAAEPLAQAVRWAEIRRSAPIGTETDETDKQGISLWPCTLMRFERREGFSHILSRTMEPPVKRNSHPARLFDAERELLEFL